MADSDADASPLPSAISVPASPVFRPSELPAVLLHAEQFLRQVMAQSGGSLSSAETGALLNASTLLQLQEATSQLSLLLTGIVALPEQFAVAQATATQALEAEKKKAKPFHFPTWAWSLLHPALAKAISLNEKLLSQRDKIAKASQQEKPFPTLTLHAPRFQNVAKSEAKGLKESLEKIALEASVASHQAVLDSLRKTEELMIVENDKNRDDFFADLKRIGTTIAPFKDLADTPDVIDRARSHFTEKVEADYRKREASAGLHAFHEMKRQEKLKQEKEEKQAGMETDSPDSSVRKVVQEELRKFRSREKSTTPSKGKGKNSKSRSNERAKPKSEKPARPRNPSRSSSASRSQARSRSSSASRSRSQSRSRSPSTSRSPSRERKSSPRRSPSADRPPKPRSRAPSPKDKRGRGQRKPDDHRRRGPSSDDQQRGHGRSRSKNGDARRPRKGRPKGGSPSPRR
jgi:hypothetical protein